VTLTKLLPNDLKHRVMNCAREVCHLNPTRMQPIPGGSGCNHRQVALCTFGEEQRLVLDTVDRVDYEREARCKDSAGGLLGEEASDDRNLARWMDLSDPLGENICLRLSDCA